MFETSENLLMFSSYPGTDTSSVPWYFSKLEVLGGQQGETGVFFFG